MAVEHVSKPWFGVQFHPESILSPQGQILMDNFLNVTKQNTKN
jgi:anthranilate/para-aminobenzoate synthase component II